MTELKGSKTEKNLKEAFAGESQARNKYTYFAKVAKKEGFNYIARIFEMTANNEMVHAKDEFKLLGGIGETAANLKAAIDGENYEVTEMYAQFVRDAEAEGFKDAANLFRQIIKVEAHHRDRYRKLLEMLEAGTLYKREAPITWTCDECGWTIESKEPPPQCPCCKHPREYFLPSDLFGA
jgi:rubrerythrin